jgi:transcriptional regulator with XRE-family HTH domain
MRSPVGNIIRRLREQAELTPDNVASALGVSRSLPYSWETKSQVSQKLPGATSLHAFLDLVGASQDDRLAAWQSLARGKS